MESSKRYQVWHGFVVERFDDKGEAVSRAYEKDGIVIDTWVGESGSVISTPKSTPVSYWVSVNETTMVECAPAEIQSMFADGFIPSKISVSPR